MFKNELMARKPTKKPTAKPVVDQIIRFRWVEPKLDSGFRLIITVSGMIEDSVRPVMPAEIRTHCLILSPHREYVSHAEVETLIDRHLQSADYPLEKRAS